MLTENTPDAIATIGGFQTVRTNVSAAQRLNWFLYTSSPPLTRQRHVTSSTLLPRDVRLCTRVLSSRSQGTSAGHDSPHFHSLMDRTTRGEGTLDLLYAKVKRSGHSTSHITFFTFAFVHFSNHLRFIYPYYYL